MIALIVFGIFFIQKISFNKVFSGLGGKNNSAAVLKSKSKTSSSIDSYVLNIFCTEKNSKYIKAVSGSGVFLSDPDDTSGIIITNAHVARHLLDGRKQCVGRTGSPAVTTHKLILRYIPSYWLNEHNEYIIGDPDQSSTGEFDFALIEVNKITKNSKKNTLYSTFKQKLNIKIGDYQPSVFENTLYKIYSYPAQKTLAVSIYSPLYKQVDEANIGTIYESPTFRTSDGLLDAVGSEDIDHGSSGGMLVAQNTHNSLIGLSTILIKDNSPQIVRIVTMKHVFDVLEKELATINSNQSDTYKGLIRQILSEKTIDQSLYSILKNQKLTSTLEQNTRVTLIQLGILKTTK